MITAVSHFLAILAFLCAIFVVLSPSKQFRRLFPSIWLEAVFVISLVATLGSLFYSEIGGLEPCVLCWYQRILMYPQPLLAYLAIVRREGKLIRPYLIALNVVGLGVALYHNGLQWLPRLFPPAPCDFKGVSCAKIYPVALSWVTIPMMSAVAFLTLLVLLIYAKNSSRTK